MKVFITGIAGFIGSNLADAIPSEHFVLGLDNLTRGWESLRNLHEIVRPFDFVCGDVRDERTIKSIVRSFKPDIIYHLAALPSHRLALTKPPLEYVEVDLLGTLHIADAVREAESRALIIFASSNKVYGHQKIPFREDMPKKPEGPYAQAKATCEDYLEQYAKYHNVCSVAIRFHHAVGKRCHSELVLPIFVEAALCNSPLTVNGRYEGDNWVWCAADFTNIDDIVRGLSLFLDYEPKEEFNVWNFGAGQMYTVLDLAYLVLEQTGSSSPIERGTVLPHEGLQHLADTTKAKRELGFEATTSLAESVAQYIAWRRSW